MRLDPAEQGIVGVALVCAAIEGLAVGGIERRVEIEPVTRSGLEMNGLPKATRSARPSAMASLARVLSKPLLAMTMPPKRRLISL